MKRYLLDTNIYIDSYERYYRNEYFPTYWEKFSMILNEHVVIPKVVHAEITKSSWFLAWLKENFVDDIIKHQDYSEQWQTILEYVQSCGLYTEKALAEQTRGWANEKIADPWLIAIAKKENLVIVSDEERIPNLGKGSRIKRATIPDVSDRQGVRCIGRNDFFSEVGLSI